MFKPGEFPGFSLCLIYSRLEAGIWKCQQEQTRKSQQNSALSSKRGRKRAVSLAGQKLLDNAYFTQAKHHSNTAVTLPHPPPKALGDSRLPPSQSCNKAAPIPTGVVSEEAKQGARTFVSPASNEAHSAQCQWRPLEP